MDRKLTDFMCNMACNKFVCATLPERETEIEREREAESVPQTGPRRINCGALMPLDELVISSNLFTLRQLTN